MGRIRNLKIWMLTGSEAGFGALVFGVNFSDSAHLCFMIKCQEFLNTKVY